jgi:hypothetical protein
MTRSEKPTSALRTPYVFAVAPSTSLQAVAVEHRCHWYEYESTPPDQVPVDAVNSSPTTALPLTLGLAVFCGTAVVPAAATPAIRPAPTRTMMNVLRLVMEV